MSLVASHPSRKTRLARPADLAFVVDLQKKWSNNLGFLPRAALQTAIEDKRVLICDQDSLEAGYLLTTWSRQGVIRVAQVALDPQLLRTTLGTKIMRWLDRCAVRSNATMIRLKSRVELSANLFWPEIGFRPTGYYARQTERNRPLIEWTKILTDPATMTAAARGYRRRRHRGETLPVPQLRLDPADTDLDQPPPSP